MKAIILAGGGGTRLWPVSRSLNPKQIVAVLGDRTLLRATFDRLLKGFEAGDILVSTSRDHRDSVAAQLPELPPENIVAEPCRRDTAAAIGLALTRIVAADPEAMFVTINSDAYVADVRSYHRTIRLAERASRRTGRTVLVGISPTYPETGYGYIKMGRPLENGAVREVAQFAEKPDARTARRYLASGAYLWNPSLIVGRASGFLELFAHHLPAHARQLGRIAAAGDDEAAAARHFSRIPAVSVDYGILEKEKNLAVLPADFGWADVGNWRAVKEILAADPDANVVKGLHVGVDSNNNLIYSMSGKLVATAGVSDMVIVETADALLVCPQDRAHDVKKIVAEMKAKPKLRKYL